MEFSGHALPPKIGLVLGSGGLKPIASVALLDFLKQENIPIELLIGCSGGSIYAGMFAMGYSTSEMIDVTKEFLSGVGFSKIDYQSLLNIGNLPGGRFDLSRGILKNDAPLEMCRKVFGDTRIENLPIKTIIQTTDLQSGKVATLEEGLLAEAVYASSAMYPLLAPLYIDGKWLADGGITDPLPIAEAVRRNVDLIITMIFNEPVLPRPMKFIDSFYNLTRIFSNTITSSQLALAIDLHHYEIIMINLNPKRQFSFSDPSGIDELIKIGTAAVEEQKEEILSAIANFHNKNK